MILKPTVEDYKIIGYYLGKIIVCIGILMFVPFIVALIYSEAQPAADFLFSISLTILVGCILAVASYTKEDPLTMHAMAIASLSFLAAMFASAIPLFLSGHYASYLDACFETISGYSTTGLSLVQNLDHMAYSYNFWRHQTIFMGGQGILVIALTFLFKGTAGAFRMYVGEAREEKILPNVIETARFIWLMSLIYLVLGSLALSISGIAGGLEVKKAVFDSVCIFMAAFDTGGFAPQSQNILFYHNISFEIITITLMVLGAINFTVHYHVLTGNKRELYRNIEISALFITMAVTLSITIWGFFGRHVYSGAVPFIRKTFYQLISSQTTTGFGTIYARQFVTEWGALSMLGITMAMAIGGSSCSTAGAVKLLRIGILYKALRQDIKKLVLPESAVLVQKIHHIKDFILEDKHVRTSAIILVSYMALYLIGAILGMLCGYSLSEALFESVSAAGNVGLSCGITSPAMPETLKITYILQMWAGRLEFISIFVLGGMVLAALKGKK